MLRPETYQQLTHLGLAHLGENVAALLRYGGKLHTAPQCTRTGDGEGESGPEPVTLTLRDLPARETCECVWTSSSPETKALSDAGALVDCLERDRNTLTVPPGNSPRAMHRAAKRLVGIEDTLSALAWSGVTSPEVLAVQEEKVRELKEEAETLLERLRADGAAAVLAEESAIACTWGGDVGAVLTALALPGGIGVHLVNEWVTLVHEGTSAEERRKHLSKITGAILQEEGVPASEIGQQVQRTLPAWEALEGRFAETLKNPGKHSLVVPGSPSLRNDPHRRLLLEAFGVVTRDGLRVLKVPPRVLTRILADVERPRRRSPEVVQAPEDPEVLEVLLGLWDPSSKEVLGTLQGALEAALLV